MSKILPNALLAALACSPTIGYMCRNYWPTQRLWRILRPARITLSDMPYDVVYALSLHLSVQDLCNLRMTSKSLARLLFDRSIWLIVLRDVLEVWPIPRLKFALVDMSLDDCLRTATRLACLARRFRASNVSLSLSKVYHCEENQPVLLPGGRFYVTFQVDERSLVVHDWDDKVEALSRGRLLVPRSRFRIHDWTFCPISADEVVVAVCSYKDVKNRLGNDDVHTHVHIYRSNPATGACIRLDHFVLTFGLRYVVLTDQYIAIQSRERFCYVRFYHEGLDTPLMIYPYKSKRSPFEDGSLAVHDRTFLLVAHDEWHCVFRLPPLQPVARLRVPIPRNSAPLVGLWEGWYRMDEFRFPSICTVSSGRFLIWNGNDVRTITIDGSTIESDGCSVEQFEVWPRTDQVLSSDSTSFGHLSGLRARFSLQPSGCAFMFMPKGHSRGHVRLGMDVDDPLPYTIEFALPDLQNESFAKPRTGCCWSTCSE